MFKSDDRVWYMSGSNLEDTGTVVRACNFCSTSEGLFPSSDTNSYIVSWDNNHSDFDTSKELSVDNHDCFQAEDLQIVGEEFVETFPVELRRKHNG